MLTKLVVVYRKGTFASLAEARSKVDPLFDVSWASKCCSLRLVQSALAEGEGCLSVDRDIPGYVPRHDRITLRYQDVDGTSHKLRLKNYPAIVCQHEIDHLNGILFFDHINMEHPFQADDDLLIIE